MKHGPADVGVSEAVGISMGTLASAGVVIIVEKRVGESTVILG